MLASAFIMGLLGSFHCIGMCGPIAFLLPVDRQNKWRRLFQIFLYHCGRITSYAIIGLAFGLIGKSLSLFGFQQQLSVIIGILMLIFILFPAFKIGNNKISASWFRLISGLKNSLGKELKKKSPDTFFTVGFLNGFLPCGLVYMAMFAAIAFGNAFNGSLYMIFFGLGTIPLMTSAIWVGNFISVKVRGHIRKLIPVFMVLIAALFILRGLGLGIPYVSPQEHAGEVTSEYECHKTNMIVEH